MMKNKRLYGWIPDVPDQRDFLYSAIRPRLNLVDKVDLRAKCPPVENQGQLGSCTANALAGNLEFLDYAPDKAYADVSRLFIYYNERMVEGTVEYDSGAMLRDGIKVLAKYGVCSEQAWPYQVDQFTRKPFAACYKEGFKHKIMSYHRLEVLNDMLTCLSDGFPFVFGFTVYESFESLQVAKTGIVPMPKPSEKVLGGHAVVAVGYDQKKRAFIIRNSWGEKWGQQGYCFMPFKYLENLARDFWTIRK